MASHHIAQNTQVMLCKPCNTQHINYWILTTQQCACLPSHVLFNQT